MPAINCPNCHGEERTAAIIVGCDRQAKMWGIVQCLACGHEFPLTIVNDCIQKLDVALPGVQSDRLNSSVTPDIKEDIQEAERANYSQCYKACVAMCRRALQLSLIDKGIEDKPLGQMLNDALNAKLLTQDTYNLSTSIKGYGDIAVHRREIIEPEEAKLVIYTTVRMLNQIFP